MVLVDLVLMKACVDSKEASRLKIWRQQNIGHSSGKNDEAVVRREYNVRSTVDYILAFILGKEIVHQG